MFNIYCINLEKDKEKWELMQQEGNKNNLIINKFNAINGNDYIKSYGKNNLENLVHKRTLDFLSNGAIGCFLSHYLLWVKVVEEKLDYIVILEDDVYFTGNAKENLEKVRNNLPEDFDVIFLNCGGMCGSNCINVVGENVCEKIDNLYNKPGFSIGTYAYIISNNGAKKLLKYLFPLKVEFDIEIGNLIQNKILNGYSLNIPFVYHHHKELSNITNMRKRILSKIGMHWVNLPVCNVGNYILDTYTVIIIFLSVLLAFKYKYNSLILIILLITLNWIDYILGYIPRDRENAIHNFIDTILAILIFFTIQNTLLCKSRF